MNTSQKNSSWLERNYTTMVVLLSLVIISGIVWYLSTTYATLDILILKRDTLTAWTKEHALFSALCYSGVYFIITLLALPIAPLFTMGGGLMFGAKLATVYTVVASTGAATAFFMLMRSYARPWVIKRYDGRIEEFNRKYAEHGKWFLLIARLIPIFPFFLVTIAAALTNISTRAFFFITLIGVIPVTYFYATAGERLAHLTSISDLADTSMAFSFSIFIFVITGAGIALKSLKNKTG